MASYEKEPEDIKCRICGKEYGAKGFPIHLKTHDKNYHEYIEEYIEDFRPFGWTFCENCGDLTKSGGNEIPSCSRECAAELKSERYSGEGNPRYGIEMSEETKRKIGEKAKERLKNPENHWNYGNKWSEEAKKKMSESHKENYQNGRVNPMKGETHDEEAVRKIFNSWENSSLEQGAKEVLEENNIEYIHHFFLRTENGEVKSYDFYLPNYNILLEMDGDYWHGGPGCEEYHDDVELIKANDKLKNKLAEKEGYTVVRVWESEYEDDRNVIIQKVESQSELEKLSETK